MTIGFGLASAAIAASNAAAATIPDWGSFPDWIQAVCAVVTLFTSAAALALGIKLNQVQNEEPEKRRKRVAAFARAMQADVKEQTHVIDSHFFAELRQHPDSMETLRKLLRNLRNELSEPVDYLNRMSTYAIGEFPSPELSSAFGKWSGAIRSLYKIVDDLHQELTYPLVNEPVVKKREEYLLRQYLLDEQVMVRLVEKVRETAKSVDKLAARHVKPEKSEKSEKPDSAEHP